MTKVLASKFTLQRHKENMCSIDKERNEREFSKIDLGDTGYLSKEELLKHTMELLYVT